MEADLGHWQTRFAQHFAELRSRRGSDGSGWPIFGLEHGLDLGEVEAFKAAVRVYIAHRPPSQDHRLAWIVYSSEFGYQYSGDEYWQTFETETPGWNVHGNRYWIRNCFRWFQKEFGGAVPSGRWAEKFSIICWPITNAILPRDLQQQLARILYELRHSYSGDIFESPILLGELIEARSWNATSRFQNLAQETQLLGQIAAALLLEGNFGFINLMHPAALSRIGTDLDRERRARKWLWDARRSAKERVHIRGLSLPGRGTGSSGLSGLDAARAEAVALGIEPRLVLRPKDALETSWEVSLEIPDLSHLLHRFPQSQVMLAGSRCIVTGAAGRPLARGMCLHRAHRVTLVRWPSSNEVLLRFENADPNPQLSFLLSTECLLRPRPIWLFRVASDGLAYECRGFRVRPSQRYILVNTTGPIQPDDHIKPIEISCDGIYGGILNIPNAFTIEWEEFFKKLGLEQTITFEVSPAGLAAVAWDGEGHGEWLASERPCLAIRADHHLSSLQISMGINRASILDFGSVSPGESVFVELPELPIGVHRLRVSGQRLTGQTEPFGDLDVVMRVRGARAWIPGVCPQGPLLVYTEPETPTLEQLWEGQVEISVRGPSGRKVKCEISLFERDGKPEMLASRLPPIDLPVSEHAWREHFHKHFRNTPKAYEAYDNARICKVKFDANELGVFTLRCEREFTPLRWVLKRNGQEYALRLLDDSGDEKQPVVCRRAFETPCVEEVLPLTSGDYSVSASGGMYIARIAKFDVAIIVPPPVVRGFQDLGCDPQIERQTRSIDALVRAVNVSSLWGEARLAGDLISAFRQRKIMRALICDVFRLICGDNWAEAESRCASNNIKAIETLSQALSKHVSEAVVGVELFQNAESLAGDTCEARVQRLALLASRHHLIPSPPAVQSNRFGRGGGVSESAPTGVTSSEWFVEFSLRLASNPASVEKWAGEHLHNALRCLLEMPILAKFARLSVIAIDHFYQSSTGFGEIYVGWRWT